MSSKNFLGTSYRLKQAKDIRDYAEKKHHSGNISDFLRAWGAIITAACRNDIPPEVAISCLSETIELWKSRMK